MTNDTQLVNQLKVVLKDRLIHRAMQHHRYAHTTRTQPVVSYFSKNLFSFIQNRNRRLKILY